MLKMIEWMCFLGAIASIGVPLLYALATLERLQHKKVYPLFRFIEHDGHRSSTEAPLS